MEEQEGSRKKNLEAEREGIERKKQKLQETLKALDEQLDMLS
jgi:hypothetical protein